MTWAVNSLPIMALTSSIHLCFCMFFLSHLTRHYSAKITFFCIYLSRPLFSFLYLISLGTTLPNHSLNFSFCLFYLPGKFPQIFTFWFLYLYPVLFIPGNFHAGLFNFLTNIIFSCCLIKGTQDVNYDD